VEQGAAPPHRCRARQLTRAALSTAARAPAPIAIQHVGRGSSCNHHKPVEEQDGGECREVVLARKESCARRRGHEIDDTDGVGESVKRHDRVSQAVESAAACAEGERAIRPVQRGPTSFAPDTNAPVVRFREDCGEQPEAE